MCDSDGAPGIRFEPAPPPPIRHPGEGLMWISVRPMPGAPVSTPLHWDEVNEKLNPSIYTMEAVLDRRGGARPAQRLCPRGASRPRRLETLPS